MCFGFVLAISLHLDTFSLSNGKPHRTIQFAQLSIVQMLTKPQTQKSGINTSRQNELTWHWITAKLWHKHWYFNKLRKVAAVQLKIICTYLNRIKLWKALREPFFKLLNSKKDIFPCFYWSEIRRNRDSEFAKSRNQGQLYRNLTNGTTWIISSRRGSKAFICEAMRISKSCKTNRLAAVSTHHMHFTLFAGKRWRWFRSRTIFTWTKRAMK